jgi:hypothetical protein
MSFLPRNIANKVAFEYAMALDVAMGGSTNAALHVLAAAHEGGMDFTMGRYRPDFAQGAVPVQGGPGQAGCAFERCPPRRGCRKCSILPDI